jgi:hypothetical protein
MSSSAAGDKRTSTPFDEDDIDAELEAALEDGGTGGKGGRASGGTTPATVASPTLVEPQGLNPTDIISPTLMEKEKSVMPIDISSYGGGAVPDPLEASVQPYTADDGQEEAKGGAGAAERGSRRSVHFDESVVSGRHLREDLAKSYTARQVALGVAKNYQTIYTDEQRHEIKKQYRDILRRHDQNSSIRKLHQTIGTSRSLVLSRGTRRASHCRPRSPLAVSDVLDPSDTTTFVVLMNAMCPLAARPAVERIFGVKLTDNYWQKNLDDEIHFFSLKFVACSVLPIFPTLVDSCANVVNTRWELVKESCKGVNTTGAVAIAATTGARMLGVLGSTLGTVGRTVNGSMVMVDGVLRPVLFNANGTILSTLSSPEEIAARVNSTTGSFIDSDFNDACPLMWGNLFSATLRSGNSQNPDGTVYTDPSYQAGGSCVGIVSGLTGLVGAAEMSVWCCVGSRFLFRAAAE